MAQNFKLVPDKDMYEAFGIGFPTGDYRIDEIRFEEFQRGWKAALEWVNNNAVSEASEDL